MTADQELASVISNALAQEGLIPSTKKQELVDKILGQNIKPEDWGMLIELAISGKIK